MKRQQQHPEPTYAELRDTKDALERMAERRPEPIPAWKTAAVIALVVLGIFAVLFIESNPSLFR